MANQKKTFMSVLLNGLIWENPTFVLMLGMCPTLAVTTSVLNGLGMSLYQGAAQIELWTGEKAPVEAMRKELMDILAESK